MLKYGRYKSRKNKKKANAKKKGNKQKSQIEVTDMIDYFKYYDCLSIVGTYSIIRFLLQHLWTETTYP